MLGAACLVLAAAYRLPGASRVVFAAEQAPPRAGQMPTLPLTTLDERAQAADLDNHTFTLTFAQAVPIRDLLLLLVRGTNLSIVPDPAIAGTFIGELKNVTVRQALELILPPLDLSYTIDGPFIRVLRRQAETRLFDVNDVATSRTAASRIGGDGRADGSFASLSSTTTSDTFAELATGVRTLVSEHGVFNLDRKAGLLQVTDLPERLDRVAVYLEAVQDRVHRQVQIDARVIEVELSDEKVQSLDWTALAQAMTGGAAGASRPSLTGLRVTDTAKFMAALAAQGTVSVLASPRLLAVNNEPAIVRAVSAPASDAARAGATRTTMESFTLSVTPQIAPGGIVMLSLSPILTLQSPADHGRTTATTRESDTIARVADGETIVMGGFGRDHETRERKATGLKSGWFGRTTIVTRTHVEVLILLTPKVLSAVSAQ